MLVLTDLCKIVSWSRLLLALVIVKFRLDVLAEVLVANELRVLVAEVGYFIVCGLEV